MFGLGDLFSGGDRKRAEDIKPGDVVLDSRDNKVGKVQAVIRAGNTSHLMVKGKLRPYDNEKLLHHSDNRNGAW